MNFKRSILTGMVLSACLPVLASAQTVTAIDQQDVTSETLVNALLGSNISTSSIDTVGHPEQMGLFSGFNYLFGPLFEQGIILSTGNVESVVASPNTTDSSTTVFAEHSQNDEDLGKHVFDPAKIVITFVPDFEELQMDFIFGSEEYNEYVYSPFNDGFQILVNDENCAKTPDDKLFSINTVNDATTYPPLNGSQKPSSNPQLFINNDPNLDRSPGVEPSVAVHPTEMDGFTRLLRCRAPVEPGVENRLVIGLVDKGDAKLDSWVFLRAGSLKTVPVNDTLPDADRDGIPDSVESPDGEYIDTDGDGLPDQYDLDSDNDGIPDSIEYQGNQAVDLNMDGLIDNTDNTIPSERPAIDTDGDGTPDYRDLDSDNDGLTDLEESVPSSMSSYLIDPDQDGMIDDLTDSDSDGLLDVVDPVLPSGESGQPMVLVDIDEDRLQNYRDTDSDGDQFDDAMENGDYNKDGINDRLQPEAGLKTAVSGIGGFDTSLLVLLPILLLFRRRTSR